MTTNTIMRDLLEQASEAQFRFAKGYSHIGVVSVEIIHKQGRLIQGRTLKPMIMWKLDGKRIAADELSRQLEAEDQRRAQNAANQLKHFRG